jgi:hypothetical protein
MGHACKFPLILPGVTEMKKFMLAIAAMTGVFLMGMSSTALAGHHHYNGYGRGGYGPGYGYGRSACNHYHHNGYNSRYGYGYRGPVYGGVAPVYPVYGAYPYVNSGFGISTPNFGLYIR